MDACHMRLGLSQTSDPVSPFSLAAARSLSSRAMLESRLTHPSTRNNFGMSMGNGRERGSRLHHADGTHVGDDTAGGIGDEVLKEACE